jgi:hypothetical protein
MTRVRHFRWLAPAVVVAALLAGLFVPAEASAHERRKIANEQAEVVVGWLVEPAYIDQPNGVDFRVTNPATQQPIEGLEKTVKVEVIKGGVSRTFDLRARFGLKGAYTADIIPTSTGDYAFRFTGEINGVKIDERFESGPGRFDGIKPLNAVQFPAAQPTVGELKAQLDDARAAADSARTIAFVGVAAGVVGLLAAAASLLLRRPLTGGRPAASTGD